MEKSVRQRILSASSFTTALAIAVPSYVAVPLPAQVAQTTGLRVRWAESRRDGGVEGNFSETSGYKQDRGSTNTLIVLPSSSRSTRECLVPWRRILAVSLNSTKKVLSPGTWRDGSGLLCNYISQQAMQLTVQTCTFSHVYVRFRTVLLNPHSSVVHVTGMFNFHSLQCQ